MRLGSSIFGLLRRNSTAVGLLVGIRLIFSGWSIAMLGMLGDATVDVVEVAVEGAADSTS